MGFGESYVLPHQEGLAYRQLGNAVVPPLIAALGAAILHALEAAARPPAPPDESAAAELPRGLPAEAGCAPNMEALRACLKLTLAAAPRERPPRLCCVPRE
eukprot:3670622-Prymnesium_polylepis.1